ncbi:MAG: methyltransferase domain-containing protein [Acidobacteria bacterium]|nr:methyltransferase domain-containing protein [Acidobacteriota bacterium]
MDDPIARHYGLPGLLGAVLEALRATGRDVDRLEPDDLVPVDEFHIRGRAATEELAALAGVQGDWKVLDVGSGLGGSGRFLARRFGCRVTGLDLTPEYCALAQELSARVGLDALTEYRCGSALAMPFEDGAFDLAWSQHAQMNIEDKARLYAEIHRVLRPGGRFVFHDILAGPGGPPHFPTHWAEWPEMSFLIEPGAFRALLEGLGFRTLAWRDLTGISRDWYLEAKKKGGGPLGLHLLLGPTGPAKMENVGRNLAEERLTIFQGLLEKV